MSIKHRHTRSGWGFLTPFLVLFLAFFILPIGYAVYQSLFSVKRTGSLGLEGQELVFVWFDNYVTALSDTAFVDSLWTVLIFALIQVPVMVLLALSLALLLEAASARGVRFFRTAYFLPYGVPGVIASILWGFLYVPNISPLYDIFESIGVDVAFLTPDTIMLSIVNVVTWEFAGYNVLILIAQLKAINTSLFESARVDGASPLRIIWHIKLPLTRPAIVMATVFTIVGSLQLFAEPLVLRPIAASITYSYTPNLAAYSQAFFENNYQLAAAQAVVLAAVAMVLSFGFLRIFGRGDQQ